MLPYPQIKVQAGLYRYLQGPGVRLKESVVSNRVRLLHHRGWTCSSIVLLLSKAQLCNQQSPIKNPTSSYKFRWSPEATGPSNRETDSQRASSYAVSLHPSLAWSTKEPIGSTPPRKVSPDETINPGR